MTDDNPLSDYLDSLLISVQSDLSSSKKLLQKMASLLALPFAENKQDDDEESREKDIYRCLLEREKLGNTGIGNGVALPHSRYEFADKATIAIITLTTPIDYDSPDKQPVDLAFGLLVPQEATQEHLRILADIARLMSQPGNKEKLVSSSTSKQVIELIESWSISKS